MSEYEETDSLTLAVAKAMAESFKATIAESVGAEFESTGVTLPKMAVWERYAKAAIKAYELHQEPALTAEEVAKVTQAVHDTIGSPAVIAKVEERNALLQALKNRDLP